MPIKTTCPTCQTSGGERGHRKRRDKTGLESRMQEPHWKEVANHPDPESCAGGRKVAGEAFDRGTRRPAIELRNHHSGVPTL